MSLIEDLDPEIMDDDELCMLWRDTRHLLDYFSKNSPAFRATAQQKAIIEEELKKRQIKL